MTPGAYHRLSCRRRPAKADLAASLDKDQCLRRRLGLHSWEDSCGKDTFNIRMTLGTYHQLSCRRHLPLTMNGTAALCGLCPADGRFAADDAMGYRGTFNSFRHYRAARWIWKFFQIECFLNDCLSFYLISANLPSFSPIPAAST